MLTEKELKGIIQEVITYEIQLRDLTTPPYSLYRDEIARLRFRLAKAACLGAEKMQNQTRERTARIIEKALVCNGSFIPNKHTFEIKDTLFFEVIHAIRNGKLTKEGKEFLKNGKVKP